MDAAEAMRKTAQCGVGWGEPQANPNVAMYIKGGDVGVRLRLTPTYACSDTGMLRGANRLCRRPYPRYTTHPISNQIANRT